MARELNRVLWEQWRQRVARQQASGLSIAAFCRDEGISQATFFVWRRKLRASVSRRPASRQPAAKQARHRRPIERHDGGGPGPAGGPATPRRSADFLQLPVRGVRSSPWIELTLVDGTLVRVPHDDLAALALLLRILRGETDGELLSGARHA